MLASRTQLACLWTRRALRGFGLRCGAFGSLGPISGSATGCSIVAVTLAALLGGAVALGGTATLRCGGVASAVTIGALAARLASRAGSAIAVTSTGALPIALAASSACTDARSRDRTATPLRRSEQLDPLGLWFAASGLRRQHRGDEDPVDLEVGIDPHDIARSNARRHQIAVEGSFGLLGSRSTPRPRAVVASTRQLDLDASAHRRSALRASVALRSGGTANVPTTRRSVGAANPAAGLTDTCRRVVLAGSPTAKRLQGRAAAKQLGHK